MLFSLLVSASAQAQELTERERAYRDSIATVNAENAANADAREAYNAGNEAFKKKNYPTAIQKFGEAIKHDPNFADAFFNKAVTEMEAGKHTDAVLTLTAMTELEKSGRVYYHRALANHRSGKLSAAENDYAEAAKLDPKNEMVPYNFGVMKFSSQDYEGAEKQFTKAISLKADFAFAYNDRGSCFRMMGKYPEAIKDYEEAARRNPNLALALNNIGTVKKIQKDYVGAIASYNRAISIDAKFYMAYNNRGAVLFEQGKHQMALEDFNKTIELKKDYAPAYNNRGSVYMKQEEYKKAEEDFSKAIQLDDKYANAYVNRGTAREMLRNAIGACQDWAKARELGSDVGKNYQVNNCE